MWCHYRPGVGFSAFRLDPATPVTRDSSSKPNQAAIIRRIVVTQWRQHDPTKVFRVTTRVKAVEPVVDPVVAASAAWTRRNARRLRIRRNWDTKVSFPLETVLGFKLLLLIVHRRSPTLRLNQNKFHWTIRCSNENDLTTITKATQLLKLCRLVLL